MISWYVLLNKKKLIQNIGAGYKTLAENLSNFRELGKIPNNLKLMRLDKVEGVESILVTNSIKFARKSITKFNYRGTKNIDQLKRHLK